MYAGWVSLASDSGTSPQRGLHEPLVSQQTFDAVQTILNGRSVTSAPRRKFNPALPLKVLIKCALCGVPLTGGEPKGRTKKYRRYWCRTTGCRAVKLAAKKLEAEFVTLLTQLRAADDVVSRFPALAAKAWTNRHGDAEKAMNRLKKRREEHQNLNRALLKAKLLGEVAQPEYEQAKKDGETPEQEGVRCRVPFSHFIISSSSGCMASAQMP